MYVAEESNSCIIYQWSDPFFRLYTLLILALGWAVHIITHSNPTSHCSASAMTWLIHISCFCSRKITLIPWGWSTALVTERLWLRSSSPCCSSASSGWCWWWWWWWWWAGSVSPPPQCLLCLTGSCSALATASTSTCLWPSCSRVSLCSSKTPCCSPTGARTTVSAEIVMKTL